MFSPQNINLLEVPESNKKGLSWLRKKKSNLSIYPSLNESKTYFESCLSLSQEPPPSYDDEIHPWSFKLPNQLSHRTILPREEEGNEVLPDYKCDIDKVFYMRVKCEYVLPNIKSKSRSWREYYIHIYGTKISAYNYNPERKKKKLGSEPIWSFSLQQAEVTPATDYRKHYNPIRLKLLHGPTFLFTVYTDREKWDCIDLIESSISISNDLDFRQMPKVPNFKRNRHRQSN